MITKVVMKYLLTVTFYLDNGAAMTQFKTDTLYPTLEQCIEAGESWKKEYKSQALYKCSRVKESNWK